jgi:phosphoribosylformylglycinamidine synthase
MLRLDEATTRGVALSVDGNGRYTRLDPYAGAQLALAEAYRNVATTGARPLAVSDCLNFGSPEDPAVMWQFAEAVRGLADGCLELGTPVTGGNVSFYNQTGTSAILPTPVVGVLGVIDDVNRRIPTGLGTEPGETLVLLGDTRDEFDGSIWAQVTADHLGGMPPTVDLDREKLLSEVLISASRDGLVSAAHDVSEGGLIQTVVEAALAGETGCRLILPGGVAPFAFRFSESPGRVLVAVPRTEESRFRAMCEARGLPADRIGVVDDGSDAVEVQGQFTVGLDELRSTSEGVLPRLFG